MKKLKLIDKVIKHECKEGLMYYNDTYFFSYDKKLIILTDSSIDDVRIHYQLSYDAIFNCNHNKLIIFETEDVNVYSNTFSDLGLLESILQELNSNYSLPLIYHIKENV